MPPWELVFQTVGTIGLGGLMAYILLQAFIKKVDEDTARVVEQRLGDNERAERRYSEMVTLVINNTEAMTSLKECVKGMNNKIDDMRDHLIAMRRKDDRN